MTSHTELDMEHPSEAMPAPSFLDDPKRYLGSDDIPNDRYYSEEFRQLEIQRMWSRVWQMACREEDIPNIGDYLVYDLDHASLLIVRVSSTEIRAYHNACLHRGTQLCVGEGYIPEIRCPFHGWTYALDGRLKDLPSDWDFPHVDRKRFSLPEVQVGTWAGFVFINLDNQGPPLSEYLGLLPEQTAGVGYQDRYKAVHISKIVRANWKLVLAAFMEGYHVPSTHPQLFQYPFQPPEGGEDTEGVRVYDGHVIGRLGVPLDAEPEPLKLTQQELEAYLRLDDPGTPAGWPRAWMESMNSTTGSTVLYYLFPNLVVWGGRFPIVYRMLPYKNESEMAVMDIMLLAPRPYDEIPVAARREWFGPDEALSGSAAMGQIGVVWDQDFSNLARVQRGLRAAVKPGITLANNQELLIRRHDQLLSKYVESAYEPGRASRLDVTLAGCRTSARGQQAPGKG